MVEKVISILLLAGTLFQTTLLNVSPHRDSAGELFLVNRDFPLSENYIPELVNTKVQGTLRLQQVQAAEGLEKMFLAAKEEEKIQLLAVSGYRSYAKQDRIYEKKAKKVGEEGADEYVAKPGTSEHQLGLAMDLGEKDVHTSLTASFANTKAGLWLAGNAHRFGFIIRYQLGWEEITGYQYEPWHVRYVGIDHATKMHQRHIPLEEYVKEVQIEKIKDLLLYKEDVVLVGK